MKICKKCRLEKNESEFYAHAKVGLRSQCKPCMRSVINERKSQRKHEISETDKAYREKNKEAIAEKAKEYRAKNPEKLKVMSKLWRDSNKDRVSASKRNRRAAIRGAPGTHSGADIENLLSRQKRRCANCLCSLRGIGKSNVHVDHIQPIAKGGSNDKYNLQILCKSCNLSKGSIDPGLWAKKNGRLL